MPWSNQSGGGSGGGGGRNGGPWGQTPDGGGPPSNFEDMLKRSQDRFRDAIPTGSGGGGILLLLALAAIAVAAFYLFTVRVNTDEAGIVTRFGKFDRQISPGINFRLPPPIEEVYLPKVTSVNQQEVGFQRDTISTRNTAAESLMLTGDENIVDIEFTVFWRIKEPREFLFNVTDGLDYLSTGRSQTVLDVAQSAMREIVGKNEIQRIITQDREKTQQSVKDLMQRTVDSYKAGIEIDQVQLQNVNPPAEVTNAYRDVQAAKTDFERAQNEAQAYANKVIHEAGGDAQKIRQEAQAYREKIEAEAIGQADRFSKVYQAYKLSPEITRKRIYLETMQRVLGSMTKVIIDTKGQGQGVVPYLPLGDLTKPGQPSTTAAGGQ